VEIGGTGRHEKLEFLGGHDVLDGLDVLDVSAEPLSSSVHRNSLVTCRIWTNCFADLAESDHACGLSLDRIFNCRKVA